MYSYKMPKKNHVKMKGSERKENKRIEKKIKKDRKNSFLKKDS